MDVQNALNLAFGVIIMGLGWMLNSLHQSFKDLNDKHHAHAEKIAEKYVTKDDFKEQIEHICQTCDNIWKAIRKG